MTEPRTTHHAPLPALRAGVFAFAGTALGVSAHHLAAEGPPPWRQSVMAAALFFGVGLVGTRRPRSLTAMVATCAAAQTGLHLWLMSGHTDRRSGAGTGTGTGTGTGLAPHPHHVPNGHGAWHERLHASSAMTVAHVLAAVLVAVLLHRADAVCWSLARGLTAAIDPVRARIATVRALLEGRPAPVGPCLPGLVLAWLERPPLQAAVLTDVVVRRGPPRPYTALAK